MDILLGKNERNSINANNWVVMESLKRDCYAAEVKLGRVRSRSGLVTFQLLSKQLMLLSFGREVKL